jgi:hypothetical protein
LDIDMATVHTPIVAGTSSTQIASANSGRRSLFVQNYAESGSAMYIAFGQPATAGTNGELEIPAGQNFSWGGRLAMPANPPSTGPTLAPACPTESINVIVASGSASGAVITQ